MERLLSDKKLFLWQERDICTLLNGSHVLPSERLGFLPEDLLRETNVLESRSVVSKAVLFDGLDHWMWSGYHETLKPPWGWFSLKDIFVTFNIRKNRD